MSKQLTKWKFNRWDLIWILWDNGSCTPKCIVGSQSVCESLLLFNNKVGRFFTATGSYCDALPLYVNQRHSVSHPYSDPFEIINPIKHLFLTSLASHKRYYSITECWHNTTISFSQLLIWKIWSCYETTDHILFYFFSFKHNFTTQLKKRREVN